MDSVVAEIEQRLESYAEPVEVAVLGCAVNGIGEASHADFGIAGAKNEGLIFAGGKPLRKVPQAKLVDTLFEEIDKSLDRGKVEVDEAESREGAEWLAKIEEENAGELTPEKIAADGEGSGRTGRVGQSPARRGGLADRGPPLHPGLERARARARIGFTRVTRLSQAFLPTLKDAPADAEAISHKLMVRAGLIRQLGAGLWTYLPAGLAGRAQGRGDHPRGDGGDRLPGDADAGAAAGRALEEDRALRDRRSCSSSRTARARRWCWR